ncbi:hypothetical protein P9VFCI_047 [Rhizobium phage P9VFCI]|uniref:Uncharacterized protein n=2 Tax=Innesvirus TaxID=3044739 RepID=A0A076YJ01_9CAUD|nr:hypothetical protein P10VF_245 [Rhizobium phage vB_RleM_P10VF]YP_010661940.1 hypothetical protein PP937_gp047 [Rhizobium phage P9VFCI]AIK68458.1 hypothetical protein P10VF_245 [Rhizobium phage vB_RleM_P10VF]QNH71933.1 hypothetical protein P9VFCI_047 [Rhizobium phage P9VFCI]
MRRVNQNYDPSTTSPFLYRRTRKKQRKPGEGMEVIDCYETGETWWRIVESSDGLFGIQVRRPEIGRYCNLIVDGLHTFTHDLPALRSQLRAIRNKGEVNNVAI